MIVTKVLALSTLVGNILYVNYVPKTYSAEICLSTNEFIIQPENCQLMNITKINGSTMWFHKIHNSTKNYFMIKYKYPNQTVISSDWHILTQQQPQQPICDCENYEILFLDSLIILLLLFMTFLLLKIYKSLKY